MTFSYDVSDMDDDTVESRTNEIRFLVGDTDSTIAMVQNEEIAMTLRMYPPVDGKPAWLAAAHVCDAIAGKFGRKVQQTIGPLSASNQMQYDHYKDLAQQMRVLYNTNGLGAIGGMSGVKAASPVLSGGGPTYLGGSQYSNGRDGVTT